MCLCKTHTLRVRRGLGGGKRAHDGTPFLFASANGEGGGEGEGEGERKEGGEEMRRRGGGREK